MYKIILFELSELSYLSYPFLSEVISHEFNVSYSNTYFWKLCYYLHDTLNTYLIYDTVIVILSRKSLSLQLIVGCKFSKLSTRGM